MKIIHAVWEKRNLGKDTMEFEIEPADPAEETVKTILANEKQYNVVKVPTGDIRMNRLLSENGYFYIESMVNMTNDLRENNIQPIYRRLCREISYDTMNSDDISGLYCELEKGLFKTDRIALDPEFSARIAGKRYINWIKDETGRGAVVFKMIYRNDIINFLICKQISGNTYSPFLTSMYEKYIKSGLGVPCLFKSIEICRNMGAGRLVTNVSSNNQSSLKGNLLAGYRINCIKNVFIKHVN